MNSLILYDSMGGNTAKVAKTIEHSLLKSTTPHMVKVGNELKIDLFDYDLIFIGSPVCYATIILSGLASIKMAG